MRKIRIVKKAPVATLTHFNHNSGNMGSEKWAFIVNGKGYTGGGFRAHGYESLTAQLRRLGVRRVKNESGYEWLDFPPSSGVTIMAA